MTGMRAMNVDGIYRAWPLLTGRDHPSAARIPAFQASSKGSKTCRTALSDGEWIGLDREDSPLIACAGVRFVCRCGRIVRVGVYSRLDTHLHKKLYILYILGSFRLESFDRNLDVQ